MRKRCLSVLFVLVIMAGLVGCKSEGGSKESAGDKSKKLPKVAVLLNGNLGDKSFFDSANKGADLIKSELGCEVNVIEMGFDNSIWETTLYETSDGNYDIIIVGTYQMQEILEKVAPEYPDKKYIIFDSEVNYKAGGFENVYSILFKQNEGGYLAGALGAMISGNAELPLSEGKKMIGVVAGMNIPVLNDFIAGYIQGAKDAVPEVKVSTSYIGDFNDTAKAKDLSKAQIKMGADVVFHVAAQAGLGVIEGAADEGRYAIGVDADQALALKETQPKQAETIATSVVKNIDQAILLSVKNHIDGKLKYGSAESLGIKEKAVDIAENEYFNQIATDEMKTKIKELREKIVSGELKVPSVFDMSDAEFSKMVESVAP